MDISDKIQSFDPNGIGTGNNIYGLPFGVEEANLVIIPVPWEVTVSYNSGTAEAPLAIHAASFQVDLYDPITDDAWKLGIAMDEINTSLTKQGEALREKAEDYINMHGQGINPDSSSEMQEILSEINQASADLNNWVKEQALKYLSVGKKVAVLGGDHSTPLGLMQALALKHESFGILQIDAHADLRIAYEGFEYSHASIMYNALKIPQVQKLVQVGVRDYCQQEVDIIRSHENIITFFDQAIKRQSYEGKSWAKICDEIIGSLPDKVYLSIDIDGLDPRYCPNTGTPVPGGLEYDQVLYLIENLVAQGKKSIIGFDINEVAPGSDEWDANVGARLLYRISNLALIS